MAIGESKKRVDAYAKVTGQAQYVADIEPRDAYVARLVRADIANGRVLGFDLEEARAEPGVVAIYTCFDVAGYPVPDRRAPLVDRTVPPGHRGPQTAQRPRARVWRRSSGRGGARRGGGCARGAQGEGAV